MPNTYFQFKKFRINQDQCGMKVCTDSCIFGAYPKVDPPKKILDIGTGTGLLALMLAQTYDAYIPAIDAIEIDKNAFHQSKNNITTSPWKKNIKVHHTSIQNFSKKTNTTYDLIICNPPFYSDHHKSKDHQRNLAIHNEMLTYQEILHCVDKMLKKNGDFFLMLPDKQASDFKSMAKKFGLFPTEILSIRDNDNAPVLRVILRFERIIKETLVQELIIKNNKRGFTKEFTKLLENFYIIF